MTAVVLSNDFSVKKESSNEAGNTTGGLDLEKSLEQHVNSTHQSLPPPDPSAHYEVPSLASMLYEFTNKEQDIVAACFRIGNYYTLRDLPDDIGANNVLQAMRERMEKAQILSAINSQNRKMYTQLGGGGGVFQKFEWVPDQFSALNETKRKEREEFQKKQAKLHPYEFSPTIAKPAAQYQYPFLGKDEQYTYSFLLQDDPYDSTKDERLRAKWIDEARMLFGEFKNPGRTKPVHQVGKSKLQDIVESLKKLLLSDWNDVNFVIGTNPHDFIEMKFDLTTIDTLQGLHAYMNTLLSANEEVLRFCLRKVTHYWGYKEANYVYYMVSPPWVKLVVNDVVNMSKGFGGERTASQQKNSQQAITQEQQVSGTQDARGKKPALFSRDIIIS